MEKLHKIYFFFFNDTATTEIYTLSLHDALPICHTVTVSIGFSLYKDRQYRVRPLRHRAAAACAVRSEEHTSELQSQSNLVCRLLLEKKKTSYYSPRSVSSTPLHQNHHT